MKHPELLRVGYFGSYARGDWGVHSDLDVILILLESEEPFERRARLWNLDELPVPVDILAYTAQEWQEMGERKEKFYQVVTREAVWVFERAQ